MSLLTKSAVRNRARQEVPHNVRIASVLTERMQDQDAMDEYHIFLSHAFDDKELILGAALTIEDIGYTVYLDWRDDPALDRKNINRGTALKLRKRIRNSRCLFFATTRNTSNSLWMPWELGFKDGDNTRCAILPIANEPTNSYSGREYLSVYPYVTQDRNNIGDRHLWIHRSSSCYIEFVEWLNGGRPTWR